MKKSIALLCTLVLCLTAVLTAAVHLNVRADGAAIELIEIESPVSFHSDLQKEVLEAGYENITDYYNLNMKEKVERGLPDGIAVSWTYEAQELPETFTVSVSTNEDMSEAMEYQAEPVEDNGIFRYAVQNLFLGTTYYYTVSDGTTTSAVGTFTVDGQGPRNLFVDGVTNIRDLGGWQTNSAETILQGKIYRSGELNIHGTQDFCITEDGIRTMLDDLHIKTEIDIRSEDENGGITQSPLGESVNYHFIPLVYADMDPEGVKEVFQILADEENYPIVYHCKIGTDRTGFITYLIYGLLDVPLETIYTDYVFSNLGLIDGNRNHKRLEKGLKDILGVKKLTDTPQNYSREYLRSVGITDEEMDQIVAILLGKSDTVFAGEVLEFDIHTERMLNYLADPDAANVFEYAKGAKDYSKPEKLVCDFSQDEGIGESETYVFQKSADEAFTDPLTVTGLEKKEYELVNLLLGEHFFWRGGTDEESITASPIHEVQVNDIPPRVCFVAGVVNVRDIGGYESTLVEGGRIRQGVFYRGAKLNSIKKKGKPQLHEELGVGLEIDLRDEQQCTGPYVDGVEYFPVPIPSGTEEERFTEFAEEYQKIYSKIAETDQVIYLHCSAGADRTGLVTFMLLALCGVQYEDIARDYMFTNFADQGKREIDALDEWWEQLGALEGETVADKAASWMLSKGVTPEQIELIRTKLVEGYGE